MAAGVPMTIRSALCPILSALAMAVATPAFAAPECLANGKSFQIGQVACLTLAGRSHLARCDMVLNNTSWIKVRDDCPENTLAPRLHTTPISTPTLPLAEPSEPTAN
ncbi:hypothetical protein LHFGNBLO_003497 [Mesorhizobium sp. AR10]|uniref:hypothetical protein n=1 Tax=Mesorhizobium sp. AR10 TaxID=2865839 RepID=UPI0022076E35|nr:hypothetical protein [Mesorhizobium sp. AR10]UVK36564.1 hypothetical protein LHFGNBLO_003497 [Mesorhizobium sp. AR10]